MYVYIHTHNQNHQTCKYTWIQINKSIDNCFRYSRTWSILPARDHEIAMDEICKEIIKFSEWASYKILSKVIRQTWKK